MTNQCPECNGAEFVEGVFLDYAQIKKPGSLFKQTKVRATVCADCGYIVKLKVDNPEKLK